MSTGEQTSSAPPRKGSYLLAIGMNAASAGFTQIMGLFRSMILARLLSPEDYGIFGLAFVVTSAVQFLINFNMTSNVIRRRFESNAEQVRYLNTTWSVELIRQAAVTIFLLLLAYPAAVYFRNPRVLPVLALCSLAPVLTGFTNVGLVLLRKEINLRNVVLHTQLSSILTTVLAISVAFVTHDVWALAISQVVGALLSALLSYKFHPYRAKFLIDRSVLKESFNFSSHLFLISIFTYITTQFDNVVVGRYLGASIVGAYMLAYRLANLPCETISEILTPVLFPVYSRIRHENPDALAPAFEFAFVSAMAAILAATIPLRLASAWLIRIVYGHQWDSAAPMLAILVFVGILRGMARSIVPLFLSLEKPAVESRSKLVEAVVFIGLTLYLIPKYQTTGAAIAGIASYAIAFLVRFVSALRIYRSRAAHLLGRTAMTLAACAVAYFAAASLIQFGAHEVVALVTFEVVFAALFLTVAREVRQKLIGIIRQRLGRFAQPARAE